MDASTIKRPAPFRLKDIAYIKEARLVIAANGDRRLGRAHLIEDSTGESLDILEFGNVRQILAANTQIKNDFVRTAQFRFDDRPDPSRVLINPIHHGPSPGARLHIAGIPEPVVSKVRTDGRQF